MDPNLSVTYTCVTSSGSYVYLPKSQRAIISWGFGDLDSTGAFISQVAYGNGSQSVKVANCVLIGLTVNELDFFCSSAGTNISYTNNHNISVLAGNNNGSGIVLDGSGGDFQYNHFSGLTLLYDANYSGGSTNYPGGAINLTACGGACGHLSFDNVTYLNRGTTQTGAVFNYIQTSGTNFNHDAVVVLNLDCNMQNATSGYYSIVTVECVTGKTFNTDVSIFYLRTEIHATSGVGAYGLSVTGTNSSTGQMSMDIYKWRVSGSVTAATSPVIATGLANQTWQGRSTCGMSVFNWSGKTSGDGIAFGTEVANFPIEVVGTFGAGAPIGTGTIVSTPVTGTLLTLGGGSAFATATTYTVGGTALGALLTGTVTIKTADGTAFMTAVAVTNFFIELQPGMTLLVAAAGTAIFFKDQ